jgi:hypothetical protein
MEAAEPLWDDPATEEDRQWWFDLAPTLSWTVAKTFSDFAPHWYVLHPRTRGMALDDYTRVGRVIRTFGEPGKFYKRTNLYLFTPDRERKFWCQWGDPPQVHETRLINLAHTVHVYGPQTDFNEKRIANLRPVVHGG